LILLAAGKDLYNRIDIDKLLKEAREDKSFWMNFSELFSTHPCLVKRIEVVKEFVRYINPAQDNSQVYDFESI
jgi:Zn-dependent protease with chaperone function